MPRRLPPGGTQGYHSHGYKPYFHGTNWECSIVIYTLLCVKEIAGGKLLCNTELSSVLCDDLGGGRGVGGDMCIQMADSLCCRAETNITL